MQLPVCLRDSFSGTDIYHDRYSWDAGSIQSSGLVALKGCSWSTASLAVCEDEVRDHMTLLQFLPISSPEELAQWKAAERVANRQESMGEDPSMRSKKKTNLRIGGRCEDLNDVNSLVANFAAFAQFCVRDFSRARLPQILVYLNQITQTLGGESVRVWVRSRYNTCGLPTYVLSHMSLILQAVIRAAASSENQDLLRGNRLTDATIFKTAAELCRLLRCEIHRASQCPTASPLPNTPLFPLTVVSARPQSAALPPAAKRPADTPPSGAPPTKSPRKQMGLLVWSGTGKTPMPGFQWAHAGSNGVQVPFCRNFLLRGLECTKPNCKFFHLTRKGLNSVDQAKRQEFVQFVRNTDGLDFAPGQEVATG